MTSEPKFQAELRLIDCLCKSHTGGWQGTGAIRAAILVFSIGIALLLRAPHGLLVIEEIVQILSTCAQGIV